MKPQPFTRAMELAQRIADVHATTIPGAGRALALGALPAYVSRGKGRGAPGIDWRRGRRADRSRYMPAAEDRKHALA